MRRRRLIVRGVVQGVGFRPFVAGLARRLGLGGFVRNVSGAVVVEVEGPEDALDAFAVALPRERPPLAVVEAVETTAIAPLGETAFVIEVSANAEGRRTSIPPDVATCEACLRELQDPTDRRYQYPFLNCTHCGPRFTIIEDLPYDRASTTMTRFAMCDACRREYENPEDRRYHAEPIACAACGPHLWWEASVGMAGLGEPALPNGLAPPSALDAIATARTALASGQIVAIKGIGGFHLACDARNDTAVMALRSRKGRGDKPFAVMVPTLDAARTLCRVSDHEAAELESRARPIALLRCRDDVTAALSPHVAPGQDTLGVMLPYSPLHHLLLTDGALVMTSGNRADEPIARTNEEARERLSRIADAFLLHDRDIHAVCDDSVIRVCRDAPLPLRRSRGFAPFPVRLPFDVPPVLAAGGELKATFCLAQGRDAYLSQHIGDMETVETFHAFERAVDHLIGLFAITPAMVAIDPHPGYLSSRWARDWASARGIPVVPVQHHRAHHAAVMAEHGLDRDEAIIGVVFDGTGFGDDGAIWGGEVFVGDYASATRAAHLATASLPAGDVDVRHGARLALAHLTAAGLGWDDDLPCVQACTGTERQVLAQRIDRRIGMTPSSSMGRLFDAVASLLGVRHGSAYEAQAAMELEALARRAGKVAPALACAFALRTPDGLVQLDPAPVLRHLVEGLRAGVAGPDLAARFHEAVARAVLALAHRLRGETSIPVVGLSGGVFQNVTLVERAVALLEDDGFRVLTHRLVPPNDGGLSLGQAVAAAAHMSR
jgi:hydrogenase maturation protein HypF